jgi:hypothetical protein
VTTRVCIYLVNTSKNCIITITMRSETVRGDYERSEELEATPELAYILPSMETLGDESSVEPDTDPHPATFAEESYRFNSEKDRRIAADVAHRLRTAYEKDQLSLAALDRALTSLVALIPVDIGAGKRQLNGKLIAPGMERRIASRLESREVDLATPEGAWGRLPGIVKDRLTCFGAELKMEITSNCTVGCSFCSFADKGPIQTKASFASVEVIMDDYFQRQKRHGGASMTEGRIYDAFYWGSDPFDQKWAATETEPERDYTDLAKAHQRISAQQRGIFTSTAIPVGEELRVLNYADQVLDGSISNQSVRFSRTPANTERIDHLMNILTALHPWTYKRLNVTDIVRVAARGDVWKNKVSASTWDITGPNCRDGTIVGVKGIETSIMQGTSPERPSGEIRAPLETVKDGVRIFTIPRHAVRPLLDGTERVNDLYPGIQYDIISIDPEGNKDYATEYVSDDPHRALLIVAGAWEHYGVACSRKLTDQAAAAADLSFHFQRHLRVIQEYLDAGNDNWVMRSTLAGMANWGVTLPNELAKDELPSWH